MDGERTYGKVIQDDKLSAVLGQMFNVWFKKWKKTELNDKLFDEATDEIWEIMMAYGDYPLIAHLGVAFLYELDARMHGGYTETTKRKLFDVIKGEFKGEQ